MSHKYANVLLVMATAFVSALIPAQAQAHCFNASVAGNWAYTYTGTIFTTSGALPAASVGHFKEDAAWKRNRQSDP